MVQAVAGIPLTVYGRGGQTRGFLNIRDTLRCVELSLLYSPEPGEYRVFNQFTETFNVLELAEMVKAQAEKLGMKVETDRLKNPRLEAEQHYYHPVHSRLTELGLEPRLLSHELLQSMVTRVREHAARIKPDTILPRVTWQGAEPR